MVENRHLNLPHLYLWPPLRVTPLGYRLDFWHQKTRVPGLLYSFVCVILDLAIIVEYPLVTDRQTDGRMDRHTMTASTALAECRVGKK